jgi:hypothetical protein
MTVDVPACGIERPPPSVRCVGALVGADFSLVLLLAAATVPTGQVLCGSGGGVLPGMPMLRARSATPGPVRAARPASRTATGAALSITGSSMSICTLFVRRLA